ncbi:uncharacterized protein LOC114973125 [Acropora millepora]|uniref:uncharacterized protein LOC114973125 n=1 Tax=Acropora millepora TaxID=45264 RepID=UPI001CF3B0CD|nr:uncharacterized protein LOC114973125 [Acropora millepora]
METSNKSQSSTDQLQGSMHKDEVAGYIHNVSPVKNGKYFDFQIQTKEKIMRGVCFSPPKVKRFTEFSESATPVKLKNFRLDTSANTEDLLMGHDVSLESLSGLDFDKTTMPTSINLNTIKSVCIGQLVTVTAKVSRLHPPREIKSKNLELQEAMLVDPSATMKLVLWADFVDSVLEGNTYTFHNIRVNKDKQTGDIYVNTAKSGTTISPAQAFTDVLPITPQMPNEYITTTTDGEILGVEKVASYLSCCKCNNKIEIVTQHPVVECSNCHLKQKQSSCPKNWYTQVLFQNSDDDKLSLTMFNDVLMQVFTITNQTMYEVSKEFIEDVILKLPAAVTVTYQKRDKIITSITIE